MAKKADIRPRTIRIDQFEKQLADAGIVPGARETIELGKDQYLTIRIPTPLDEDDFGEQLVDANSDEERMLLILDGDPNVTAEDALAAWRATGKSDNLLIAAWHAASKAMGDAYDAFRTKGR